MQEKTTNVAEASAAVDLNIHKNESKILRCNTTLISQNTLDGEDLEDAKSFTHLGSNIDEHSGSDEWIGKARAKYLQPNDVCNSKQLSTNTRLRIFNTIVKTVLLCGEETWRTEKPMIHKIYVFFISCLRKILQIHWPDTMGENNPDPSGGRNQEVLEVDRTQIEESTQLCHKGSPYMKSSRSKEKRKSKEQITPKMETDKRRMNNNWIELGKKAHCRLG
ncbi:unnamed protein product [Schistosoma margrebowiei]|uniref:Uncharacterized protein n=1 Tax=Schistosoma margrebowiei TaxID=48269 RepID=A0A183LXZ6_9TREM|nr:unnamed protein product [Schistosoma margrebowiei]